MNCRKFQSLLPGRLYGELSPREIERLGRHCAACPACRRLWAEMEETVARIPVGTRPRFSPREMARLRARVREVVRDPALAPRPAVRPFRLRISPRPLFLPAAATLAAAALLLLIIRPFSPPAEGDLGPSEAAVLVALSETVETELQLLAEVWDEIEAIEDLFSPDPAAGSEAGRGWRGEMGSVVRRPAKIV